MNEKSIKVIGPKVWEKVPEENKVLHLKKSFTKHMKSHYLNEFPTEFSTKQIFSKKEVDQMMKKRNELNALFQDNEDETDFLGFDLELGHIFASDSSITDEFFGF